MILLLVTLDDINCPVYLLSTAIAAVHLSVSIDGDRIKVICFVFSLT